MREILFRGKDLKTGRWVYGYFVYCASMYDNFETDRVAEIIPVDTDRIYRGEYNCHEVYEVDIDTVGQFTGLVDKNGTKIFEGDLVKLNNDVKKIFNAEDGYVWFNHGCFFVHNDRCSMLDSLHTLADLNYIFRGEVVGNIYDNPELMEKEETNVKTE